jgi:hypothetical protein
LIYSVKNFFRKKVFLVFDCLLIFYPVFWQTFFYFSELLKLKEVTTNIHGVRLYLLVLKKRFLISHLGLQTFLLENISFLQIIRLIFFLEKKLLVVKFFFLELFTQAQVRTRQLNPSPKSVGTSSRVPTLARPGVLHVRPSI